MPVTRVQFKAGLGTSASSFSITYDSPPINGNFLCLSVSVTSGTGINVSGVSSTGATWVKAIGHVNPSGNVADAEIWYAENVSSAGSAVTVSFSGSASSFGGEISEYSGISSSSSLDKTASNDGVSSSPDSGTTASTTTANELWISSLCGVSGAQSSPTNSFSIVDSSYPNAYLEKIVSSTGTANTGTSQGGTAPWSGVIATFKQQPPITIPQTLILMGCGK